MRAIGIRNGSVVLHLKEKIVDHAASKIDAVQRIQFNF